ncbi:hypothetical protein MEU_00463 [Candida albicans P37005]|nr:hypothetical protein MEU_00463 [Candida albicans P37005]
MRELAVCVKRLINFWCVESLVFVFYIYTLFFLLSKSSPYAFENGSCVIFFFTTKLKPLCFDFALWVLIVSPGVKVDGGSGVVYNRASSTSKQTEMANTFYIQRKKGVFKVRFKLERDSSSFFEISICGCKKVF